MRNAAAKLCICVAALAASGCELTPTQRTLIGAGVLIVATGAIQAHRADSGADQRLDTQPVNCTARPESCR